MTIVIKEILVKTTIERANKSPEISEEALHKLKQDLQRDTVKFVKEQYRGRKER
jgi:hypothetical protein